MVLITVQHISSGNILIQTPFYNYWRPNICHYFYFTNKCYLCWYFGL